MMTEEQQLQCLTESAVKMAIRSFHLAYRDKPNADFSNAAAPVAAILLQALISGWREGNK